MCLVDFQVPLTGWVMGRRAKHALDTVTSRANPNNQAPGQAEGAKCQIVDVENCPLYACVASRSGAGVLQGMRSSQNVASCCLRYDIVARTSLPRFFTKSMPEQPLGQAALGAPPAPRSRPTELLAGERDTATPQGQHQPFGIAN